VINNSNRQTVNPPAPTPQNRANKPPSPPPQQRVIATNQLFRVEVQSNSTETLAKIQEIEPLAFIRAGENVIQVGLFQQQYQAKQRVQELTKQGFSAQIITLNN
jgi:cell division septation protein DedD